MLALPSARADNITYAYDELGRVVQATDSTTGQSVVYVYDAAGNILTQTVLALTSLAVAGFSPNQGLVGTQVKISGTGFSATPASNTVKFNGTAATVSAASTTVLTVTVPSGATTGHVSVTVGSTTVTTTQSFTVGSNGAPTITGFSPTTGAVGTSITITGTKFLTTGATDKVLINGTPTAVTAATATTLTVAVPPDSTSGPIQVVTPYGTATSATNFIVLPIVPGIGQLAAASVATIATATENGGPIALSVPSAGKYVIGLFSGTQGDVYVRVVVTGDATGAVVLDPTGVAVGLITAISGLVDIPRLPRSGIYSVVVTGGSAAGSVSLTVVKELVATLNLNWSNLNVTGAYAYQRTAFTFSGGQNEIIQLLQSTEENGQGTPALSLVNSSGTTVWSGTAASAVTLPALPSAGSYTLLSDPGFTGNGNFAFISGPGATLTAGPDPTPSLLGVYPSGTSSVIGLASFQATAGQTLTFSATNISGTSAPSAGVTMYYGSPTSQTQIFGSYQLTPPYTIQLRSAPVTATYYIAVNPLGQSSPLDVQLLSAPGSANTSPVNINILPGQMSVISFAAPADGKVGITLAAEAGSPQPAYGVVFVVGPGSSGSCVAPSSSSMQFSNVDDDVTFAASNTMQFSGLTSGAEYYLYITPATLLYNESGSSCASSGTLPNVTYSYDTAVTSGTLIVTVTDE